MYITNLEEVGARAEHNLKAENNELKADKAYNSHKQLASISLIPLPNDFQLQVFTQKVKDQSLYKRVS